MNTKYALSALLAALLMLGASGQFGSVTRAQEAARPLTTENFAQAAPRGFGDRNNSWAQSMLWWQNNLYVGTGRAAMCTSLFSIWRFAVAFLGPTVANTYLPYPPPDPDLACPPNGADLSLQAEIWQWSPGTDTWRRVFQSPLDLDNPGPPLMPGKKLPYEMTFRGMAAHTDPDGTDALYAFGVNTAVMWDSTKLPPPRILRTTDGINWVPIPQTPGTFLGDLPFNADHSSFRSPVSFNNKLFVLSGPIFGQGSLIGSADPAKGDNAWFLGAPKEIMFYEMAAFNGWLYLGTIDTFGKGYSVIKTRAEGPPPYQFVTVIPPGAYHPNPVLGSKSVVSMHVYDGRLHVGTASFTELIRINPDDTWDVVMGPARQVPLPAGGTEMKYPLSGLDNGFGTTLNDHAWQMDDPYRYLYVGTYNAGVGAKDDPINGPLLEHAMGAHLYRTNDGWYYSAITTNGFSNPADPYGGKFDYGIRTMAATPHGAFFGTANDWYGFAIFRANTRGSARPDPPGRLEIEPIAGGASLLSWNAAPHGQLYEIWRAKRLPIQIRAELNFEAWNGVTGNMVPDIYVGPYQKIGTTDQLSFIDSTVVPGELYMYYVTVVHQGLISDQSNLVSFPLLTPPMTFARLQYELTRLDQRKRLVDSIKRVAALRTMLQTAQTQAASCQIENAILTLNSQRASNTVLEPDASDLEIMMAKIKRRLRLYTQFPQQVISTEFCTL